MSDVAKILIVDDEPNNLQLLESVMSGLPVHAVMAGSGDAALACTANGEEFAAILLDVVMPGMDGFETAQQIRQRPALKLTPIMFLTALQKDHEQVRKAYTLGAVDYIFKPIMPEILRAKVEVFLNLYEHNRQLKQQAERFRQEVESLNGLSGPKDHSTPAERDQVIEVYTDRVRAVLTQRDANAAALVDDMASEFFRSGFTGRNVIDVHLAAINRLTQNIPNQPDTEIVERARTFVLAVMTILADLYKNKT